MKGHIGILGGGQLGRMLALAARPLGLKVTVLDPSEDAPGRAAATHIQASFDDREALTRLAGADWVTFEFENVPDDAVLSLKDRTNVAPPPRALTVSQDRWVEKNTFVELGIGTAPFRKVDSKKDAEAAFAELGPIVLKTRRFGYDGKGQARAHEAHQVKAAYEGLRGAPAIAEKLIPFDRELSVVLCRNAQGNHVVYSLTENTHEDGILSRSVAPAPGLSEGVCEKATAAALRLAEHLDYVGVLALELFLLGDEILANEFAPRVHNSGHWTIEGAATSQFENHIRAVVGLPLGSTEQRAPAVMTNLIGSVPDSASLLEVPDTHLHDYDKEARPGRKVGHVTSLGSTIDEAVSRADRIKNVVERSRA